MTTNTEYEKICQRLQSKEISFETFSRLTKQVGLEKRNER